MNAYYARYSSGSSPGIGEARQGIAMEGMELAIDKHYKNPRIWSLDEEGTYERRKSQD